MHTFISSLEYLGIMMQGGGLIYFSICIIFLFIIMPQIQPKRNEATVAIHKSLGFLLLIYVFNNLLWIIPELASNECGYYSIASEEKAEMTFMGITYGSYNTFMEYLDLAILPLSMVFGSTVLLGKLPKKWLGTSILVPYILYAICDIYEILPFQLYTFAYVTTLVLNAVQLAWYRYFIKKFDIKLLNNCSDMERRSTRWVFWTLVPIFLLTIIYYPLNMMTDVDEWMVLYDFLTILFLTGIVGCALAHKVDDMTIDLINEQIEELKPEEDKQKEEAEPAEAAPAAIEATAATPVEASAESVTEAVTEKPAEVTPTTETQATDTQKVEEPAQKVAPATTETANVVAPKAKPANEAKFTNFAETIQKLEEEQFFLDTEVNIDWISSKLGTNRHYVSDFLNQVKHVTFYEYVNTLRLNYAEQLLKEGKEKVADVAFISGFNSDHTFRRLFKEKYGCTPLQYQKNAA